MKYVIKFCFIWLLLDQVPVAAALPLPTFDLAAVSELSKQLFQMQQQYYLLQRIQKTQTGHYGQGKIGLDAALRSSYVVPGSWQDVVGKQRRGVYGAMKTKYANTMDPLKGKKFRDADGMAAKTYQSGTDAVFSAMAGGEAIFEEVAVHLKNMRKFARRVDTTVNSKDAQDLQNRIAAENGMLQTAMAKATVLATHVQAHIAHYRYQAIATNQRYFKLLK